MSRNTVLCGNDVYFMTTDRLVTLPFASLGPQIWTEAAVEGGRTTVDESLTALPGPVYFHPPGGATCTRPLSYPGPPWGSSNCSAALYSGSPSGAKQTSGRRKRSTSNLVPSSTHPHTQAHTQVYCSRSPHFTNSFCAFFNSSQLSWYFWFHFLHSVLLSLPLHSPEAQPALNTHTAPQNKYELFSLGGLGTIPVGVFYWGHISNICQSSSFRLHN